MGAEISVFLGLGIVTSVFAYYGLSFIEREEFWTNLLGQLFFIISLLFLLLLVNTTYLVIVNSGLSYLSDTIGTTMLQAFYYLMLFGIVIYIFYMFTAIYQLFIQAIKMGFGGRQKTNKQKGENNE